MQRLRQLNAKPLDGNLIHVPASLKPPFCVIILEGLEITIQPERTLGAHDHAATRNPTRIL